MVGVLPGRKEREAFELLKRNSSDVLKVVKIFDDLVQAFFSKRDLAKAERLGRELSAIETKADRDRRKFAQTLHEGAFLPVLRGDLAGLAEKLDDVADAAEEAMRSILLREKLSGVLARLERRRKGIRSIREGLVKMSKLATKSVEALHASIEALMSDLDLARDKAQEVERLEHESDILEQGLTSDLYVYEKLLDPISLMQLKEVIGRIGSISDRAEDASDMISIVGYTIKP